MIDLAVAIAVLAKFHGHGPVDALATSLLNVDLVVLFRGGFRKSFIRFQERCFEVIRVGVEGKRLHDLSFLPVSVRDDDFDA